MNSSCSFFKLIIVTRSQQMHDEYSKNIWNDSSAMCCQLNIVIQRTIKTTAQLIVFELFDNIVEQLFTPQLFYLCLPVYQKQLLNGGSVELRMYCVRQWILIQCVNIRQYYNILLMLLLLMLLLICFHQTHTKLYCREN